LLGLAIAVLAVAALALLARPASAVGSVDLSVSIGDSADPVQVGAPLTLQFTVTNNSGSDATLTKLKATLATSLVVDSITPSQGSCTQQVNKVKCDLGTIPGGTQATVDVDVTPHRTGTLTDTANVTATQFDPDTSNNDASEKTSVVPNAMGCTILGTTGDDVITGTPQHDVICALDGADEIHGGDGPDTILPGPGDDPIVDGGNGDDMVSYADISGSGVTVDLGTGQATGGGGTDTLTSIEDATGTSMADTLTGDDGPNRLVGRAGADTLSGNGGGDTLLPGLGNDVTIDGGGGFDWVRYSDITGGGVTIDVATGSVTGAGGTETLTSIEAEAGSNQDDTIIGDGGDNNFKGLQGDDYMDGKAGSDTLNGDGGTDTCLHAEITAACEILNNPPTTGDDTFDGANAAVGNTKFAVGVVTTGPVVTVSGDLISNDSDQDGDTFVVTANSDPPHGTITTMNSDGTFVYVPDAGFSGTDTFTYTVTDNGQPPATADGNVSIDVGTVVWYVDNSLGTNGDGRSISPFNVLSPLNGAGGLGDPDGTDDILFLYQGSGNYTGGIALEAGQMLLGQPNGLTVNGNNLVAAGGSNPVIANAAGAGITLAEGVDIERVNVTSTSGAGITGTNVNTATIGSSTSITSTTGNAFDLSGGNGTISLGASITNSSGRSVSIVNRTGGTVTFPAAISDSGGTGIFLNNNGGTTIKFTSGSVNLSTGTSDAFTATGGGTVEVTGATNVLTTTTGTALKVTSTTISANGLTFQSISSNGAANGILLSSTGTGPLTVTGNGGTCTVATPTCTGGHIQNTVGVDGASSGTGVSLTNTGTVSLTRVHLNDNDNFAVRGATVSGFTLDQSVVDGANGDNAVSDEGAVIFTALTGTATISNTDISGALEDNIRVVNSTGSLTLNITSDTVHDNNPLTTGQDGMLLEADGTATMIVAVTNSTFSHDGPRGIQAVTNDSATMTFTVKGTTFDTNFVSLDLDLNSSTSFTYTVGGTGVAEGNTFQSDNSYSSSQALNLFTGGTSTGLMTGSIKNNDFSMGTGSTVAGAAIVISPTGNGNFRGTIDGNTIDWPSNGDINATAGGTQTSTGHMDVTITNNTLDLDSTAAVDHNILVVSGVLCNKVSCGGTGSPNTSDANVVCADINGNTVTGKDIRVRNRWADTQFRLPGYSGGALDTAAVNSFLSTNNNSASASSTTGFSAGFGGGAACAT